jgi:hypothetical protein
MKLDPPQIQSNYEFGLSGTYTTQKSMKHFHLGLSLFICISTELMKRTEKNDDGIVFT